MQEVELKLIAPNAEAVKSIREVAAESKKMYDNNEKQQKTQLGLIEREIKMQQQLTEKRNATQSKGNLETYNRLLDASKKRLSEYEKAGLAAEKTTETLTQSIGKWALSLGGAVMALRLVKDAVLATTTGLNAFNIAGAAAKQVMYNLVTGASNLTQGLSQVIKAQKELNALRLQEKVDMFKAKGLQIEYNRALVDAHDQTKNTTERLNAYNLALQKHNEMIDLEIESVKKRKNAIADMLKVQADDEKLKIEYAELATKILDLENQRWAGQKEIMSMKSGLEKKQHQDLLDAWHKEIELDNEKYAKEKKLAEDKRDLTNDIILYRLEGMDRELKAAELAYEKDMDMFKDNAEMKVLLTKRYGLQILEIQETFLEKMKKDNEKYGTLMYFSSLPGNNPKAPSTDPTKLYDSHFSERNAEYRKQRNEDDKEEDDSRKQRLETFKEFSREVYSFTEELLSKELEDAQRHRELLDTRVSELQQELETETRLYEAGYASNVGAKKKELADLKKQREQALLDEEKAIQRKRQLEALAQGANIASSVTNILKESTEMGPLGLIAAGIAITAMFALIASAKKKTKEAVLLARGGHGEVTGRLHSQGGEKFLDHVEVEQGERWGVLSRSASRKYGKVFGEMVDSFNKEKLPIPKNGLHINNINLNNDGPNRRLDEVNNNLRKIHAKEEITQLGNMTIIKKGENVRIVRR